MPDSCNHDYLTFQALVQFYWSYEKNKDIAHIEVQDDL